LQNLLKRIARSLRHKKILGIFLSIALLYPFHSFSQDVSIVDAPLAFDFSEDSPISENPLTSSLINAPEVRLIEGTVVTDERPTRYRVSSLSFSWNEPVNIAAFRRNGHLWVIFDQRQNLNIDELSLAAAPLAWDFLQLPHSKGTILRMTPNEGVNVSIRREGFLWIVDLYTRDMIHQTTDLNVLVQSNSVHEPFLFIPTAHSGNILSFIDPEIGDNIIIVPTSEIGKGVTRPYRYPDLEIIPSIQGLVIVPISSDLIFNRGNTGVSITALNRGLNISPNLELLRRRELLSQTGDDISSLTRELPLQILNRPFLETVNRLRQDVIVAEDIEARENAKMELARYYVGKGLATNAIRIMEQMRKEEFPITQKERFHILLGVANFMARRYPQAIEEFSFGRLSGVDEAIFWRTLASSAIEFRREDNAIIQSFMYLIKDYPNRIKEKIAIVGVQAAIRAMDDVSSQHFIDILRSVGVMERNPAMIDFFNAEKLIIQSYPASALREYRKGAEGSDLKYSSFSRFESLILSNRMGVTSNDTAIAGLERLKFAWGERSFKLKVFENLSVLYERNKDYYNALNSLRMALPLANDRQRSLITQRMVLLFEDVFVLNQADHLPAIKSISLFKDFDWLAPLSRHHNNIIQNLSDRLVAVDLLDRAAELLRNQLRNPNLSDDERARAGARLALVGLFQNEYKEAFDALNDSEAPGMSETTRMQRRIIMAKALAGLGQEDRALQLLEGDTSRNALLIKSKIFWDAERWSEAADNIRFLVEPPVDGEPLSMEQIGFVLDWITALKQAGKETVIVRIRNRFYPFFKETKFAPAFNVLTNLLEDDEINISDVHRTIRQVQSFSNFTKSYLDALRNRSLTE
jgi:hypothetical protein